MTRPEIIAAALSDANGHLTLAGIIHVNADIAARGKACDLMRAYTELLFSMADARLLSCIAQHCETHAAPPTPETVQAMAAGIYKELLHPPAWSWADRLRHNLDACHPLRETLRTICAALGLDLYLDRRAEGYPLHDMRGGEFSSSGETSANVGTLAGIDTSKGECSECNPPTSKR